jgi:hypothetical protein
MFSRRRFGDVREFTPGGASPPLATAAGPAAVVTCNEALFPRTVNERIADGGGYILNLANDGWLGVHKYSERVLDMVALRSIEHRRYAVRLELRAARRSSLRRARARAPLGRGAARRDPLATAGNAVWTLRGRSPPLRAASRSRRCAARRA